MAVGGWWVWRVVEGGERVEGGGGVEGGCGAVEGWRGRAEGAGGVEEWRGGGTVQFGSVFPNMHGSVRDGHRSTRYS